MTNDLTQQQFHRRAANSYSVVIPRVARVFLAVELVLAAGYFVLAPSALRAVVYCAIELGTVAALVIGIRIWRPSRPHKTLYDGCAVARANAPACSASPTTTATR